MSESTSFRDLRVWKQAMALAERVYSVTGTFPSTETFGLVAQARRSAVSVPSNIAEGAGRGTRGEKRQFFAHARGSLNELRTQIELAARMDLIGRREWESIEEDADQLSRGLAGLLKWSRQRNE